MRRVSGQTWAAAVRAAGPRSERGSLQPCVGDSIRVVDGRPFAPEDAPMAMALDTLAYSRRLREAGFSEAQAEGQAEALAAAMTDTLATKQDLADLRHEMREMEARLDARFARVDGRFAQIDGRFAVIDVRFENLERHVNLRFEEMEKRLDARFEEMERRFDGKLDLRLANLERRMTMRFGGIMVSGIAILAAVVKLA